MKAIKCPNCGREKYDLKYGKYICNNCKTKFIYNERGVKDVNRKISYKMFILIINPVVVFVIIYLLFFNDFYTNISKVLFWGILFILFPVLDLIKSQFRNNTNCIMILFKVISGKSVTSNEENIFLVYISFFLAGFLILIVSMLYYLLNC